MTDRIRRGEVVEHYETVRVRKESTPIDISLALSLIADASGAVIGASRIARDITGRKRAETQFRAFVDAAPDAIVIVNRRRDRVEEPIATSAVSACWWSTTRARTRAVQRLVLALTRAQRIGRNAGPAR